MRFSTIYYICSDNIAEISDITGKRPNVSLDEYLIENWRKIKRATENLYVISSLKNIIEEIYKIIPTPFMNSENLLFNNATLNIFIKKINELVISVTTIIELYESLGYEETTNDLEVKIPDNITLDKLEDMIKDLNFVLNRCPLIENDGNTSKLIKSDVGSIWLVLAGSALFLESLGYVINVAIKAKADLASIKQMEMLCSEMSTKTNAAQEMQSILKEKRKLIMDTYLSDLKKQTGKELNPEEDATVIKCLEKLDKLFEQEMVLYAAIDTPREIQTLFPKQPELKSLSLKQIELLTDKEQ